MGKHDFERSVRNIVNGIACERRWRPYTGVSLETVDMHTIKQCLLVMRMLFIENSLGNPHSLDFFRLLSQALVHDLSEGHPDYKDVNYHEKRSSPEFHKKCKEKEALIHDEYMMNLFGEFHFHLAPKLLDMDPLTKEQDKLFWEACEHISHCMYILEEVRLGTVSIEQQKKFHHDVKDIHFIWIRKCAWQFESAKYIVIRELEPKWKSLKSKIKEQ